ncbi:hypothetical protein AALB53_22630 [Lachnospiraceae bacterium 47-T17]
MSSLAENSKDKYRGQWWIMDNSHTNGESDNSSAGSNDGSSNLDSQISAFMSAIDSQISELNSRVTELNGQVSELNNNSSQPRNKKWNVKSILSTFVTIAAIEAVPLALWGFANDQIMNIRDDIGSMQEDITDSNFAHRF